MLTDMIQVDASKRPSVNMIIQKSKWFKHDKSFYSRVKGLYKALEGDTDLVEQMNSVKLGEPKPKKQRA